HVDDRAGVLGRADSARADRLADLRLEALGERDLLGATRTTAAAAAGAVTTLRLGGLDGAGGSGEAADRHDEILGSNRWSAPREARRSQLHTLYSQVRLTRVLSRSFTAVDPPGRSGTRCRYQSVCTKP